MNALAFFALATTAVQALPHANNHQRLHAVRALDIEKRAVKLAPIAGRDVPTLNLSPIGQCGGSSGYQCSQGMCCSEWGYCGIGPQYCGGSGSNSTTPASTGAIPVGYSSSALTQSASIAAPAPSSYAPPASSAAPATTSAPAPASYSAPAAPSSSAASGSSGGSGLGNVYKMYSGDGSPSQGWPSQDQWASFDDLFAQNKPLIMESCSQWGVPNNSEKETTYLKDAITSVSASASIDPRFTLAIVMQESKGCVRVITTSNSVTNPGLMQSYEGSGSCNRNGVVQTPCPQSQIIQMIQDGVNGTPNNGLADDMKQTTGSSSCQNYYETARIYNSGSLPSNGNLVSDGATNCYCSDVANRLTGWTTSETQCTA